MDESREAMNAPIEPFDGFDSEGTDDRTIGADLGAAVGLTDDFVVPAN